MICPFQCDFCVFQILAKRNPDMSSEADVLLLETIRRLSLDAFWSRETSTVTAQGRLFRKGDGLLENSSVKPRYPRLGPFPVKDVFGYQAAVQMLWDSLGAGKYSTTYKQFATVRQLRGSFANIWEASVEGGAAATWVLGGADKGKSNSLSTCPTNSVWFKRFVKGCEKRMGQDYRPNAAISLDLMKELMKEFEGRVSEAEGEEKADWIGVATYSICCFVAALQGEEGFMLDLGELFKHAARGRDEAVSFVILPLVG